MDVREQVELDYARAHRRALVGRFLTRVRRRCAALCAFEEARREQGAENRRYLGRRTVEVGRVVGSVGRGRDFDGGALPPGGGGGRGRVGVGGVVGSVGRWRDFDGGFMPTRASAGRWKRVDLAFRTGRDLPPVVLYKPGDDYYVVDGNHRVSAARFEGVEMIDAEVTEFFPRRAKAPQVAG